MAIADGVGEGVGSAPVRIGRVHRIAGYRVDDDGAVAALADCRHSQRVPIGIAVVAAYVDRDRRVFLRRGRVVGRHGGMVDRRDGDRDRTGRRTTMAVVHDHREGVGAGPVGVGGVGVAAVGVHHDLAVGRVAALAIGQRVAVHVVADDLAADGGALGRGLAVIADGGRVIDRRDGDGDGAGGGAVAGVHRHGESVGAVEVLVGRVGVAAVGVDHHVAMGGIAALAVGQCVAIGVAADDVAADRGVFGRGFGVVADDGRNVVVRLGLHRAITAGGGGQAPQQQRAADDGQRREAIAVQPQRAGVVLAAQRLAGQQALIQAADGFARQTAFGNVVVVQAILGAADDAVVVAVFVIAFDDQVGLGDVGLLEGHVQVVADALGGDVLGAEAGLVVGQLDVEVLVPAQVDVQGLALGAGTGLDLVMRDGVAGVVDLDLDVHGVTARAMFHGMGAGLREPDAPAAPDGIRMRRIPCGWCAPGCAPAGAAGKPPHARPRPGRPGRG